MRTSDTTWGRVCSFAGAHQRVDLFASKLLNMTHPPSSEVRATHALGVFHAEQFRVTNGVQHGDAIGGDPQPCLGDTYTLDARAQPCDLALRQTSVKSRTPVFTTLPGSTVEPAGTAATLSARLTFMTQVGVTLEAYVISCTVVTQDRPAPRYYLYATTPIEPAIAYTLIKIEAGPKELPCAQLSGLSFGRGTRVTLASGAQRRVEELTPGVRILTRDSGAQPIKWVGKRTVQAVGAFAPVMISQHALGNAEDLTLSQQHRIMISDWRAEVMMGSKDVLIRAADLVNDDTIYIRSGGFVEYTQLVFDDHQVIYAEGIPTESLNLTSDLLNNLPADIAHELLRAFPDLKAANPKPSRIPLETADAVNLLRQTGRL